VGRRRVCIENSTSKVVVVDCLALSLSLFAFLLCRDRCSRRRWIRIYSSLLVFLSILIALSVCRSRRKLITSKIDTAHFTSVQVAFSTWWVCGTYVVLLSVLCSSTLTKCAFIGVSRRRARKLQNWSRAKKTFEKMCTFDNVKRALVSQGPPVTTVQYTSLFVS
jgi:hypothetical protein